MSVRLKIDLAAIVGEKYISDSLYERRLYDHDIAPLPSEISLIFKTVPDVVVKPKRTEEVSEIVKYAYSKRIPIVPRAASSWGYGGTIPTNGGIVIELTEIKGILGLDEENMTVTVETGLRWGKLLEYLDERGFAVYAYPSSTPSATIGGWIATGGLGIGSLKYGHLKEHIKELNVVTPTGECLTLSRENKPETFEAFFGSEGTLGVITEATLKIHPKPEVVSPQLTSFEDIGAMENVIAKIVEKPRKPFFIEMMDSDYLSLMRSTGLHAPEAAAMALFIFEGSADAVKEDIEDLKGIISEVGGSILSIEEAKEAWEERFYPMKIRKAGPTLLAGEVTHDLSKLQYVVDETRKIKEKHGLRLGIKCFMVADDTVLYMPMYLTDERERWKFMSLLPVVNEITRVGLKAGGRPYGFGIWNAFFLKDVYGEERVKEMKDMKGRMDPGNIMNPGKMYQVRTKYGIPLWGTAFKIFTSFLGILRYF
ncbi:MAG: FAD-binding oxidoreductase [Candidatus Bathyarchaeota archaeon]|jgi:glycolate oxidase